jgi:hypothetical protein
MNKKEETPSSLESIVIRLFHCMTESEGEKLVRIALLMLARRCSLNPHYRLHSAEDRKEELANRDLDSRLAGAWPAEWKGQSLVDLDNMGDPGAWLDNSLGERISEMLFGSAWDDEAHGQGLAESYIEELANLGADLPSDFISPNDGEEDVDNVAIVEPEFIAFLKAWRERVLETIEKQNRKPPAS